MLDADDFRVWVACQAFYMLTLQYTSVTEHSVHVVHVDGNLPVVHTCACKLVVLPHWQHNEHFQ